MRLRAAVAATFVRALRRARELEALGGATRMDRIHTLPGNCKSLSDTVRVIGLDGAQLGLMTLLGAQTLAADHGADLIYLAAGKYPIFRLVDDELRSRLQRRKT